MPFNVSDATLNFAIDSTDAVRAIQSLDALAKQAKVTADAQQQFSTINDQLAQTLQKLGTASQLVTNQMQVMMQQQTDQIRLLQSQVWTYTGMLDLMSEKARDAYDALRAVSNQIGTPLIGAERFLTGTQLPVYTPPTVSTSTTSTTGTTSAPAVTSPSTAPTTGGLDDLARLNSSIAAVAGYLGPLEGVVKFFGSGVASLLTPAQPIPAYGKGLDDATLTQVLERLTAGISDRSSTGSGSQIRGGAATVGVDLLQFKPDQQLEAFKAINDELAKLPEGWNKAQVAAQIYGSYNQEIQDAIIRGTREVTEAERVAIQERQRLQDEDMARRRAQLQQQTADENNAIKQKTQAELDDFAQKNVQQQVGTAFTPVLNAITAGPRFLLGGQSAQSISQSLQPNPEGTPGILESLRNLYLNFGFQSAERFNSQQLAPDPELNDLILQLRQQYGILPRTGQQGPYPQAALSRPDLFGDSTNELLKNFSTKQKGDKDLSITGLEDVMQQARNLQENYFDFTADKQKQLWDLIYNYAVEKNKGIFVGAEAANERYTVAAIQQARARAEAETSFQKTLVSADPLAVLGIENAQLSSARSAVSGQTPNTLGYNTDDVTRLQREAELKARDAAVFLAQQQQEAITFRASLQPQAQEAQSAITGEQVGTTPGDQLQRATDLIKEQYDQRVEAARIAYNIMIAQKQNQAAAEQKLNEEMTKADLDRISQTMKAQLDALKLTHQAQEEAAQFQTQQANIALQTYSQTQTAVTGAGVGAGLLPQNASFDLERQLQGLQVQQSYREAADKQQQALDKQSELSKLPASQVASQQLVIDALNREATAIRTNADLAYEAGLRKIDINQKVAQSQEQLATLQDTYVSKLSEQFAAQLPSEQSGLAARLAQSLADFERRTNPPVATYQNAGIYVPPSTVQLAEDIAKPPTSSIVPLQQAQAPLQGVVSAPPDIGKIATDFATTVYDAFVAHLTAERTFQDTSTLGVARPTRDYVPSAISTLTDTTGLGTLSTTVNQQGGLPRGPTAISTLSDTGAGTVVQQAALPPLQTQGTSIYGPPAQPFESVASQSAPAIPQGPASPAALSPTTDSGLGALFTTIEQQNETLITLFTDLKNREGAPAIRQAEAPLQGALPTTASTPAPAYGPPTPFSGLETQYGLPQGLLQSLEQTESGGRARPGPDIPGGAAQGYFQFTPATAAAYNVQPGNLGSEAEGAARYIADLTTQLGSLEKALAAYGGFVTKDPSNYVGGILGRLPSGGEGAQAGQSAATPVAFHPQATPAAFNLAPVQAPVQGLAPPGITTLTVEQFQQWDRTEGAIIRANDAAKQHAELLDNMLPQLQRQVDDQNRIAAETLKGTGAQQDLNIQLRVEAEARKANLSLLDPAIQKYGELLQKQQAANLLIQANQQLHGIDQETKLLDYRATLIGLSAEKQQELTTLYQLYLQLVDSGQDSDHIQRILDAKQHELELQQKINDANREQQAVNQIYSGAERGIENSFTNFFENVGQKGKKAWTQLADDLTSTMNQAFSKLLTQELIRPLLGDAVNSIFGSDFARSIGLGGVGSGLFGNSGGSSGGSGGGLLGGSTSSGGGGLLSILTGQSAAQQTGLQKALGVGSWGLIGDLFGFGSHAAPPLSPAALSSTTSHIASEQAFQNTSAAADPLSSAATDLTAAATAQTTAGSALSAAGTSFSDLSGLFKSVATMSVNASVVNVSGGTSGVPGSSGGGGPFGFLGSLFGGLFGGGSNPIIEGPADPGPGVVGSFSPGSLFGSSGFLAYSRGGRVGIDGDPVIAPLTLWENASRYQFGGLVGDEHAIIAHRGERILNQQETLDYDARKGGGKSARSSGATVHMHIYTKDADSFRQSQGQIIAQTMRMVNKTASRYT